MTEKDIFFQYLKPLENGNPVIFESIETGGHNTGYPDINYFTSRANGAIELKVLPNVDYNRSLTIRFQTGQRSKLNTLRRVSSKVYVLLYVFNQYFLIDDIRTVYENVEDLRSSSCWNGKTLNKQFLETLRKFPSVPST